MSDRPYIIDYSTETLTMVFCPEQGMSRRILNKILDISCLVTNEPLKTWMNLI